MPLGAVTEGGFSVGQGKVNWSRTKRMMQKRHQWEVSDLRKAGLNPILSAGGAPSMGSPPNVATPNVAAHAQARNTKRQNSAQRNLMREQRHLMRGQFAVAQSQTAKNLAEAGHTKTQNLLTMLAIPSAALDASIATSASGQAARKSREWIPHLQGAAQAVGSIGLLRMMFGGAAKPVRPGRTNAAGYPAGN